MSRGASRPDRRGGEPGSRFEALERLARLAPSWPDLPFHERGEGGLAGAIVQESVRRWRCAEWLAGMAMERDPASIEAPLRAALVAGITQALLMDEPGHAVVDETVEWSKRRIRPGAAKLANAVLRRVLGWAVERVPTPRAWWRRRDLLPRADGLAVRLDEVRLPESTAARLAVATSHADTLILRWLTRFGEETAADLASHGLLHAPRLVADPTGALRDDRRASPHRVQGFVTWRGSMPDLLGAMRRWPSLRVQDPGSARAVARTAGLRPRLVVDACAGRGTKTHQLAELHPDATIVAGDPDPERARSLAEAFRDHPRVRVESSERLLELRGADLLVLDVPCSNTGVLARRPEAKARFDERRLHSLVALQARIVEQHRPLLGPEGRLLYATCSLEPEENEGMAVRIEALMGRRGSAESSLPEGRIGGDPADYADGGASLLV